MATHYFCLSQGLPDSSVGKETECNSGDPGSIPGSGRSTGEGIVYPFQYSWASLVAQLVKNLPAMWETWVKSLGWRRERLPIPFWPRGFHGLYSPWGHKESNTSERLSLSLTCQNQEINVDIIFLTILQIVCRFSQLPNQCPLVKGSILDSTLHSVALFL